MYCSKCGNQVSDNTNFCPFCDVDATDPNFVEDVQANVPDDVISGSEPLDLSMAEVPLAKEGVQKEVPPDSVPAIIPGSGQFGNTSPGEQRKISPKKIKPSIIIALSVVIVAIAAVFVIPVAIGTGKAFCYQIAVKLMDAGKYQEAKVVFEIASYKDSKSKATECQNALDYKKATDLIASEDYETAKDIFMGLGAYMDSASLAQECGDRILYKEAVALAEVGDYSGAKAKLILIFSLEREEYADLLNECTNNINYTEAVTAFDKGRFYTAYKLFSSLGGFKDSADKAANCEQDHPATGEIYRNSDYSGSAITLKIETPQNDARSSLLKIYTADGTHVLSLFIRDGESHNIRFPAGTYTIKAAYGEKWYGPEDLFGDNAVYQTLLLEGSTTYSFSSSSTYTLTLRSVVDGNVNATRESRSNF